LVHNFPTNLPFFEQRQGSHSEAGRCSHRVAIV
jgi:hypothetical protein